MKKNTLLGLTLLVLIAFSCQKEDHLFTATAPESGPLFPMETIQDLEDFEKNWESGEVANSRFHRNKVYVPADSRNSLQNAIERAGRYGIVILEKGIHYEDNTVTIRQPVYILGEKEAKLEMTGTGAIDIVRTIEAAIIVKDTRRVVIWGLDISSGSEIGGVAILIDNSEKVVVAKKFDSKFCWRGFAGTWK